VLQMVTKSGDAGSDMGRRAAPRAMLAEPSRSAATANSGRPQARDRLAGLEPGLGNQALLRMLSASGSFAQSGKDAPLDAGAVFARQPAISLASGAPVLRRRQAGGSAATGTATPAAGGGLPAPSTTYPWDPTAMDANIQDNNNPQCLGTVNIGGGLRFSKNCGNVKGPFCQAAGVDFRVDFFVDTVNGPRPGGFTPPTVLVQLIFVDSAGKTSQTIDKKDAKPRYVAPGTPLEPSFGHDFPFSTAEDGTLSIHLQLVDPDSATTVDYKDSVSFTVTPCA
jgi:hypothetical protein